MNYLLGEDSDSGLSSYTTGGSSTSFAASTGTFSSPVAIKTSDDTWDASYDVADVAEDDSYAEAAYKSLVNKWFAEEAAKEEYDASYWEKEEEGGYYEDWGQNAWLDGRHAAPAAAAESEKYEDYRRPLPPLRPMMPPPMPRALPPPMPFFSPMAAPAPKADDGKVTNAIVMIFIVILICGVVAFAIIKLPELTRSNNAQNGSNYRPTSLVSGGAAGGAIPGMGAGSPYGSDFGGLGGGSSWTPMDPSMNQMFDPGYQQNPFDMIMQITQQLQMAQQSNDMSAARNLETERDAEVKKLKDMPEEERDKLKEETEEHQEKGKKYMEEHPDNEEVQKQQAAQAKMKEEEQEMEKEEQDNLQKQKQSSASSGAGEKEMEAEEEKEQEEMQQKEEQQMQKQQQEQMQKQEQQMQQQQQQQMQQMRQKEQQQMEQQMEQREEQEAEQMEEQEAEEAAEEFI